MDIRGRGVELMGLDGYRNDVCRASYIVAYGVEPDFALKVLLKAFGGINSFVEDTVTIRQGRGVVILCGLVVRMPGGVNVTG